MCSLWRHLCKYCYIWHWWKWDLDPQWYFIAWSWFRHGHLWVLFFLWSREAWGFVIVAVWLEPPWWPCLCPGSLCALGAKAASTAVSSAGLLQCTVISSSIVHHCKHPPLIKSGSLEHSKLLAARECSLMRVRSTWTHLQLGNPSCFL